MPDIELNKEFLKIDGSEDDNVLAFLTKAAKLDLKLSGVPPPAESEDTELYDLAVMLRVKRELARDDKEIEQIDRSLTSIILKLKNWN